MVDCSVRFGQGITDYIAGLVLLFIVNLITTKHGIFDIKTNECILCANETFFKQIKDFVYSYHTIKMEDGKEKEVTLEDACFILSIPLRDMYLAEHPDITYTE